MYKHITLSVSLASLLFFAGCGSGSNTGGLDQAQQKSFTKLELRGGGVNHKPIACPKSYTTSKDTNLTDARLCASDEDNDVLTYSIVDGEGPAYGTVSDLNASSGFFTYVPDSGYIGTDTFKYIATDEHNLSSDEQVVTIEVKDQAMTKPSAPTNLESNATTNTSISLLWVDTSDNETGFVICLDGVAVKTVDENVTSVTIDGLQEGTEYRFTVKAKNDAGCSNPSNCIKVSTDNAAVAPAAPTDLIVAQKTKTCVRLNWTDNANNESGYKIYQDGELVKTVSANSQCAVISGLASGSDYTFVVKAFNSAGEAESNEVTVTLEEGNSVPIAYSKTYCIYNDSNFTRKLCANDADGDTLTYAINTTDLNGSISDFNATSGEFTYVPTSGFVGTDSFKFTASDETNTSQEKEITIKVCEKN